MTLPDHCTPPLRTPHPHRGSGQPGWQRSALVIALALLGSQVALADKTAAPKLSAAQVRSLDIQTAPVRATTGAWISFPAEIVIPPAQQRVVAAPTAGLIEALAVSPGEHVQAGQWLVRLRSPQSQELQRDVLQTRSQLDLAQRQVGRDEALYHEGLIPLSRLEASRAQLQQTKAQAQERQSALSATTGQPTPDSQGMLSLRAPMAGQVLEQLASVGQRVDAMTPIYRVASLQTLWVDIQVPAREAAAIRIGDAVQLPVPGTSTLTEAKVLHLGAAIDTRSQTLTVRAQIQGKAASAWRPGQLVQAQVRQAGTGSTASLPSAALMPAPAGKHHVFVARSAEQFERVEVQVLSRDGDMATVTGLPADARVVVRGTAALKALMGS